jgi:hypothetical protein
MFSRAPPIVHWHAEILEAPVAKRFSIPGTQLVANVQLLMIVCASVLIAGVGALLQSEGSLRERLWAGLVIALAPACIAWPQLFRGLRLVPVRAATRAFDRRR